MMSIESNVNENKKMQVNITKDKARQDNIN